VAQKHGKHTKRQLNQY